MISDNVYRLKDRINKTCLKSGRGLGCVTLVAVSKGRGVEDILKAAQAGLTDIGENKIQEAIIKYEQLTTKNYQLKWHMIGHLQTNKVKDAVKIFKLIHSVDSIKLAGAINIEAAKINKIQDILIEIKTSPEATKYGFKPEDALQAVKEIGLLKNVNLKGLMTIAPVVDTPEQARSYFRQLRVLKDTLNELTTKNYELSMGMTDDFEIAIEEGATMVRLGRAVFLS